MVRVDDRLASWEIWRQDDNGNRYLVANHHDRVFALAQALGLESGHPHKQIYEVLGPPGPLVRTNRDLYLRLLAVGDHLDQTKRALLDYLCALYAVTRPLGGHRVLDTDCVAATLTAAATATPARPCTTWRVADLSTNGTYTDFADFTKVLCTQITDLISFEEFPPGPYASLGVDAPPRLGGGRATIERWCNFDPATFLECAGAGALGGWAPGDGRRVRTAEPGEDTAGTGEEVTLLEPFTWGDFAAFLEYGQSYE